MPTPDWISEVKLQRDSSAEDRCKSQNIWESGGKGGTWAACWIKENFHSNQDWFHFYDWFIFKIDSCLIVSK